MGKPRCKRIDLDIDLSHAKVLKIRLPCDDVPIVRRPRYEIVIPDFRPIPLNLLMRGTLSQRMRLERKSHKIIGRACKEHGVAPAEMRRRVSMMIAITSWRQETDRDSVYKATFDSLVLAKALKSDRYSGVEIGYLKFYISSRVCTTLILEDDPE